MTVAHRFRAYLSAQYEAIAGGEAALRKDQSSVHRVRVGVRRFRSTLRTFRPLLPRAEARRLEDELGWYGMLLGEVRDRQVQRARMRAALAALPDELILGPVAARIEQDLTGEQLGSTRELVAALDSARYRRLLADLGQWSQEPPLAGRVRPKQLRRMVRSSVRKTRRRLRRGLAGDDTALHRARKAAKRTRYAAELAGAAVPHPRRTARRFEKVQTVLGDHQDTVVARELLRRWGAGTVGDPDQNGFTYGLLHQREAELAMWSHAAAGLLRV